MLILTYIDKYIVCFFSFQDGWCGSSTCAFILQRSYFCNGDNEFVIMKHKHILFRWLSLPKDYSLVSFSHIFVIVIKFFSVYFVFKRNVRSFSESICQAYYIIIKVKTTLTEDFMKVFNKIC